MVLFRKTRDSDILHRVIQLTILNGNNETEDFPGKIFDLQTGNNLIGRDQYCEVVLNSRTISRKHANLKVNYDRKKFSVIDLGSANGVIIKPSTVLKGAKKSLKSGDEIQIGEILLKLLAIDMDESLQTMNVDNNDLLKELK